MKTVRKYGFTVLGLNLICLALIGVVTAQSDPQPKKLDSIKKLRIDKPSVFLSFQENVTSFEQCTLSKQKSYRLRLNNNTSIPISVEAGYGADDPLEEIDSNGNKLRALPKGALVRLCYDVESTPRRKYASGSKDDLKAGSFCSCKNNRDVNSFDLWIASGSYVDFDIPKKFLSEDLMIFTLFNYEWEFTSGVLRYDEPYHRVYFLGSDIR